MLRFDLDLQAALTRQGLALDFGTTAGELGLTFDAAAQVDLTAGLRFVDRLNAAARFTDAAAVLEMLVDEYPKSSRVWFYLGTARARVGNDDLAHESGQRAGNERGQRRQQGSLAVLRGDDHAQHQRKSLRARGRLVIRCGDWLHHLLSRALLPADLGSAR